VGDDPPRTIQSLAIAIRNTGPDRCYSSEATSRARSLDIQAESSCTIAEYHQDSDSVASTSFEGKSPGQDGGGDGNRTHEPLACHALSYVPARHDESLLV
jgi:hypothetical protein